MVNKYSKRIIWIHWISSVLIIALIVTGVMAEEAHTLYEKYALYQWHFPMGTVVFVLTLLRVIAFFRDQRPDGLFPKGNRRQKLINFIHRGFYWTILWMCMSGLLSLVLKDIYPAMLESNPEALPDLTQNIGAILLSHHIVAKFVMLFFIMHVVGVFSYMLQKKKNVLKRIW